MPPILHVEQRYQFDEAEELHASTGRSAEDKELPEPTGNNPKLPFQRLT
jgi:hypothetical protein